MAILAVEDRPIRPTADAPWLDKQHEHFSVSGIGLHKIVFYFEAVVHKLTILSFPPPSCIAYPDVILLHDYWAVYDFPSGLPFVCYTPNNIGNNNIV